VSRKRWLIVVGGVLVVLLAGRMVLRYLDWQASEAAQRSPPVQPIFGIQSSEI
jgi:hypothetical protein